MPTWVAMRRRRRRQTKNGFIENNNECWLREWRKHKRVCADIRRDKRDLLWNITISRVFGFVSPHSHTALSLYVLHVPVFVKISLEDRFIFTATPKPSLMKCATRKSTNVIVMWTIARYVYTFSLSVLLFCYACSQSVLSQFSARSLFPLLFGFGFCFAERCNASHFAIFDSLLSVGKWQVLPIETGTRF